MAAKPVEITTPTIHLKWLAGVAFSCPECGSKLEHLFNDGGRKVVTIKGTFWVVTNFYRCWNIHCKLNKAFSIVQDSVLKRKKHGVDVWAKVIQHRFKHRIDYKTISDIMWDDWEVDISPGTIQAICESFEVAARPKVEAGTKAVVQKQGRIVLRLDGAQPEKGRPSFWTFLDNVSGKVLHGQMLEKANWEVLVDIFKKIEKDYGIKITGGISDKQANIVKAFQEFRPGIPHGYCQYHFLDHVAEPIAAKDSHLLTRLRSAVRDFSLVEGHVMEKVKPVGKDSPVSDVFAPIIEELKCAVATTGDCIKIFPGIEAHANLEHVFACISPLATMDMPARVKRSLTSLVNSIEEMLNMYRPLQQEIAAMLMDFNQLRCILGHKNWKAGHVKRSVDKWVYMLRGRLKRRQLEHDPSKIRWVQSTPDMKIGEAWQQWIRLVDSYEAGLYLAYDNKDLAFNNNDTESIIHKLKYQFKKWLGRDDIQSAFEVHADTYAKLLDFDFTTEKISEVLLTSEIAVVNEERRLLHALYASTRRTWRIREKDTGNIAAFKRNLRALTE
ncbi:MAG: hypothetical protein Q6365_016495 [Candidatus Sigynarchaeota archaeon]